MEATLKMCLQFGNSLLQSHNAILKLTPQVVINLASLNINLENF